MGLLAGDGQRVAASTGTWLGALFESLVTLSVRVYAEAARAQVGHLRTRDQHEVDLIIEGGDRRVVAIEVKLAPVVREEDVRHLNWLHAQLGDRLADKVVVNIGELAYRRPDGVAVIPLALLGP
jgi:predicted AAA+ superfamily ATPase